MAILEATFHPGEGRARKGVCLLWGELVRAGLTDRDETFGGDI